LLLEAAVVEDTLVVAVVEVDIGHPLLENRLEEALPQKQL
jgi:hypothetical protein